MDSLYTPQVREYMNSRDWPVGLQWIIEEYVEPEPHLNIVFFRDNWLTLSVDEQLHVTAIIKEVMAKVWGDGIPTYVGKMKSVAEWKERQDA